MTVQPTRAEIRLDALEARLDAVEARGFVAGLPLPQPGSLPGPARVTCRLVIELVALYTNQPVEALVGDCRTVPLVHARHMAIWLCMKTTGQSSIRIGRAFGDRDHSSILHAQARFDDHREQDTALRQLSDALLGLIRGGQ